MLELNVSELGEDITGDPTGTPPAQPAEPKVDPGQMNLIMETAKAQVLGQLSLDPEIRKVLELRQRGQKVKVEEDRPAEPAAPAAPAKPLNEMDNSELTQYMLGQVGTVVSKVLDERLQPVGKQFEELRSAEDDRKKAKIDGEIRTAQSKYKDFGTHAPLMQQLANSGQFPGAGVEDLYFLAKLRSGTPMIPQNRTDSERPVSHQGVRSGEGNKKPVQRGNAGFNQLLSESLSKLDMTAFPES